MNSNHRVNVVRIKELRTHPNADCLSLVDIDGYQVVVRTEEFDTSKLYAFIQPDSVVPAREPYKFLWADQEFTGEVPERYRRITVRRFRKEWSEGLLMPLIELLEDSNVMYGAKEGDDISELVGIAHYVEPEPGD